ncbi:MAG: glycerol-3-phosphate dehydrogenase/oxidase [Dehalococcoidia bacterium]
MSLEDLANGPPLDAVIIGGGINGAAIAAEAAARGAGVALFEASDFGFGTTWRSTKLIHGGLRYLEHGDMRLVFESLRERAWLLKTRPYLVRPQRFILPVLPWTRRPGWQLRAGLSLYDSLSLYRGTPSHRSVNQARLRELAGYLPDAATSGFTFFDARVLAPERLALELVLHARDLGASVHNHAPVRRLHVSHGRIASVDVESGGTTHEIPARMVINAAGPWVDAVNEQTGLPMPELLGSTRGSHIVVELDEEIGHDAVFSTARSDGRVFFAVPQGNLLLIGTTDDRFDGDAGSVRPTPGDIDYLLDEAGALMPGRAITRERIRYAYAGLRPLQRMAGGPEAAITRRHTVVKHREHGGPQGLVSLVGGKLSTFRPLAREVVSLIPGANSQAARLDPPASRWRDELLASGLPKPSLSHLRIYGGRVSGVLAAGRDPVCIHAGAIEGEISHAVRNEQATTLSDILMRRTGIAWSACRGLCCHERAAEIAARELGWNGAERKRQVKSFEKDLEAHLPTVEQVLKDKKTNARNRT